MLVKLDQSDTSDNRKIRFLFFLEFEELPASQGRLLDNTEDNIYSEEWANSDHQDDPTYTPDMKEDSPQSSEAGSDWSSQKQSVCILQRI